MAKIAHPASAKDSNANAAAANNIEGKV